MRLCALLLLSAVWLRPAVASWPNDPSTNLPVCTNLFLHQLPDAVSDGQGGVIILWEDYRVGSNAFDVYAQRVTSWGAAAWTINGIAVTSAVNSQRLPRAVTDGTGGAIVVWVDERSDSLADIYAQRITASGSATWQANGVPVCDVCDATVDYADFDVTSDGAGGMTVVWADHRNGPASDLYAQRLDANGMPMWAENGVVVCAAVGIQNLPTVTTTGDADLMVAWADERNVTSPDIFVQRLDGTGAPLWTGDGIPICSALGVQTGAEIVLAGAALPGEVFVCWVDDRYVGTSYDIYAQRVSSVGVPQWTANGIAVCTAPDYQVHPTPLVLNGGSLMVCWGDNRNGLSDLYAARLDPSGTMPWTPNGVPICVAPYGSLDQQLVSDGAGGAIVSWSDDRNVPFEPDVYAQRVDADGNSLWTPNGVVVSNAPYNQHRVCLVSDDAGGAIAAWEDWRNGGYGNQRYRIYAQRITSDGSLGMPTGILPGAVPAIRSFDAAPNPFSRETTLSISLDRASSLQIEVFSVAGERVLVRTTSELSAGAHRIPLAAQNEGGQWLPSGIYLCRVSSLSGTMIRKLTVTR